MSIQFVRPKTITEQVNIILRERIHDKTYPPGSRLPSESHLSEEFGVSRSTVRTALTKLAAEGLLLRKHGDGTYINPRLQGVNTNLGGLWEFSELIEKNGFQASIKLLHHGIRKANITEARELNIDEKEEVVELRRLFFANFRPVILVSNSIPCRHMKDFNGQIDDELSIREILRHHSSVRIAYAISNVRAALASGDVASILEKNIGEPLLNLQISFFDINNVPIVTGSSYYDDTFLNLRLVQPWH